MVTELQMWARRSDSAGSEPSGDFPSFLLEKQRALSYLNSLASGLWNAMPRAYWGCRPGVARCRDGALLEIIAPS